MYYDCMQIELANIFLSIVFRNYLNFIKNNLYIEEN